MMKIYRRIFFWLFFLLFLITAPAAILYTQGYRFDKNRDIFVHSGSITVKSVPTNVSIYLDGELRRESSLDIINNSITLNGLKPGNYNLRVEANGYWGWGKNLEVHSGLSTEFWNIVLAPKEPQQFELNAQGLEKYFPSPFGKEVAYMKKNSDSSEIWITDIATNEASKIFSNSELSFPDNDKENIEWNFKEDMIIVPVIRGQNKDYVILDITGASDPLYLSGLTNLNELNNVRWSPQQKDSIYFMAGEKNNSEGTLYRISLGTKQIDTITDTIATYDLSSKSVYYMKQSNILYKSDLEGRNEEQISLSPFTSLELNGQSKLIVYDDDRQALIAQNDELYVRNNGTVDTTKKLSENVKSVQFSDDGKKLLFWNNNEINVLFLREWKVQPRREENEIQQVIRFSSPIENVFWYKDYEHIFFNNQKRLRMIELDGRDRRLSSTLIENNIEIFPSSYDSANGVLYYVKVDGDQKKLYYINIPEKTSFFGG